VGKMQAGDWVSTVAGWATLECRIGFVPGETRKSVEDEIKNWGHVGLCIGEGKVIHALDTVRLDHYLDVQNLTLAPGWSQPQFIGWAPMERIFVGYRKK
jgi:hypothetical protein